MPDNGATARNGNAVTPRKPKASRKKAPGRKTPSAKAKRLKVSDDAIRVRAYLISEQRARLAIPGDAHSDWIEARRQLLAELGES